MSAERSFKPQENAEPILSSEVSLLGGIELHKPIALLPRDRVVSDEELLLAAQEMKPNFEGKTLPEQIELAQAWIMPQVIASHIHEHTQLNGQVALAPQTQAIADRVRQQSQDFQLATQDFAVQTNLDAVRQRLRESDMSISSDVPDEVRAAVRLLHVDWQVLSDLDNTLTDHKLLAIVNGIDPTLVGSAIADPLNASNRENFPELYAAIWRPLLLAFPEVFAEGGKAAPIREGADELFRYLIAEKILVSILSTNFKHFPRETIRRIAGDAASQINLFTVTADEELVAGLPVYGAVAVDKGNVLLRIAAMDQGRAIVYFGDGSSDRPALSEEARKVVAVYFALEGSTFHKELLALQKDHPEIIFFTYKTGHDIRMKLEEIGGISEYLQGQEKENDRERRFSAHAAA